MLWTIRIDFLKLHVWESAVFSELAFSKFVFESTWLSCAWEPAAFSDLNFLKTCLLKHCEPQNVGCTQYLLSRTLWVSEYVAFSRLTYSNFVLATGVFMWKQEMVGHSLPVEPNVYCLTSILYINLYMLSNSCAPPPHCTRCRQVVLLN